MIASRNPDAFGVSDGDLPDMYTLISRRVYVSPRDVLSRLVEISRAVSTVFRSRNTEVFEDEDAMEGFFTISDALTRSLGDLLVEMEDHLSTVESIIRERDKARAEAQSLRMKLACYDFVRDHSTEEIERMAAGLPAKPAPDLSEPVGGAEDGIEDPGDPATRAG